MKQCCSLIVNRFLLPRLMLGLALVGVLCSNPLGLRPAWAGGVAGDGNFDFPLPLPQGALPVPSFTVEPNESRGTGNLAPSQYAIKSFKFSGSTIYSDEQLAAITAPFIGKTVSTTADLKILEEAAQAITDRYRKDGYFLSYAYVPGDQTVADGVYNLAMIEGYVSEVVLEGDVGPVESLLRSYLGQIPEKRPLNLSDAERYLQLARDVPGISLSSIFRRATSASGGRELHIKIERRIWGASLSLDNRGTLFIEIGRAHV